MNPLAPKRLSIFLLIRSLDVGGSERQLVLLAKGLKAGGHSVQVGLFYGGGRMVAELVESGVEVVDLGKSGRWDPTFATRLVRELRRRRPDLIYSFLGGANLVASAIRAFIPKTRLVWSVRASDMKLQEYGWVESLSYKLEQSLSGSPDLIIANSSAGAAFAVRNRFPPSNIVVVPNGIETTRFRPDPQIRRSQRHAFGLTDNEVAIGVLSRLDPMKGQDMFLQAARIVTAEASNLRFFCIGYGPERRRLEQLAESLGPGVRVEFTGEQEPVAALNALDIACSCSVWGEGFPNSIAEAMACGLPCVVTDVGDSKTIVGSLGAVVPPHSPEKLAEALLATVASLAVHDPERVRARITDNFSAENMVEGTLQAFEQIP
jgi:glycosyltransferase involved in cell wall biosynthesis